MSKRIILITGASSGFGALAARALADADGGTASTVYAGMRDTAGRKARQVQAANDYSAGTALDLRAIELDVNFQDSVDAAVQQILGEQGRIDVLIHNAGHMVVGPAEAFTPEQLAELYDVNVLSTQRVNRAVLPGMRQRGAGLVVWVAAQASAAAPAVPGAVLRRQGGHGLARGELRRRADQLGIDTSSSSRAPSPAAPTTSPTPARPPTPQSRPPTTRSTPASWIRSPTGSAASS